mgnify:CR=1 FL=1
MTYIVLDDEQARLVAETPDSIELRDRTGQHLGYVAHGFTPEDIAIAKQRQASGEPCWTTQEVLEHLHSLEK